MIELIIAGVLQGILEWLPVSSEGIVSLFLQNAGYSLEQAVDVALFLHAGTLIATISFFWKDLKRVISPKNHTEVNLLKFMLLTTIVSLILAAPLYLLIQLISTNFSDKVGLIIGSLLIITGVIQLFKKSFSNRKEVSVTSNDAVITGLAQGAAILPGISRSGSTTLALIIKGFDVKSALRLSFIVSIPAVFFAQLISGVKNGFFFDSSFLLAGGVAFIIGRLSIKYLIKAAEKVNFSLFCIVFGLITIIF